MDLSEIKSLLETQGKAWEEFKKTNDERLDKLAKGEAVADLEAKLSKLNTELSDVAKAAKELEIKANRPNMGGDDADLAKEVKTFNGFAMAHAMRLGREKPVELSADAYSAYKSGFSTYLRKGKDDFNAEERKAVNVGTDPEGGLLVTSEMEAGIDRIAVKASAMRQLARVIQIGSTSYKKIVTTTGASAGGWGGETTAPSETTTPKFSELEFTPGMVWAEPRATAQSLEDAVFDVEGWLQEEVAITLADQESQAFIDGNGVQRPRGLLSYTTVADASYEWGKLGFLVSGAAADFAASNPSDRLIDLVHALKRTYRAGAGWLMNDLTLAKIRKFKDGQGNYLWAPSGLVNGVTGQLLGYGVTTDDYMPDVGAGAFPLAFGDFKRGYYVIDRRGTTVLRDPYTAKPYIKFFVTRRVGGGVANFEAIKLLKISA